MWVLSSASFSLQSQATTTPHPPQLSCAGTLPCACLIGLFPGPVLLCLAHRESGLWHDEEHEKGVGKSPFLEPPTAPPSLLELFNVLAKVKEGGKEKQPSQPQPLPWALLAEVSVPWVPRLLCPPAAHLLQTHRMHVPCKGHAGARSLVLGTFLNPLSAVHPWHSALWLCAMRSPLGLFPSPFRFPPTWFFSKIPPVFHPAWLRGGSHSCSGNWRLTFLPQRCTCRQQPHGKRLAISSEKSCPGREKRDLDLGLSLLSAVLNHRPAPRRGKAPSPGKKQQTRGCFWSPAPQEGSHQGCSPGHAQV